MADPSAIWSATDARAAAVRAALLPIAAMFRTATTIRNALYDTGLRRVAALGAPVVSVGNLSVGGTGKTPFSAWIAATLRERGASPAVLLRGVGGDETLVHRQLLPGIPVVANADRRVGASEALMAGADVLVLDDGFQHRRVARDEDLVLLSADAGLDPVWPLPAGPWREPFRALRRATAIVVTRKAASPIQTELVVARASQAARDVPLVVVQFVADELRECGADRREPVAALAGERVLLVSGIADPGAYEAQVAATGAVVHAVRFADHHIYDDADVPRLLDRARNAQRVVCTLKDAVKLAPRWPPGGPPLWYVSQRVTVERGQDVLERAISRLLALRTAPAAHPPPQEGR